MAKQPLVTLQHNSFALASAIGQEGHCAPAARTVRDGHHRGALFAWDGREWTVVDLENREWTGRYKRLAVVTLHPIDDYEQADDGLNQAALGIDLETPGGEWVIDADDLGELQITYGNGLTVLWIQEGGAK
jgi:hypothetical protein